MDPCNTWATGKDVQIWEQVGRDDILAWVETIQAGNDHCIHDIWIPLSPMLMSNDVHGLRGGTIKTVMPAVSMMSSQNIAKPILNQCNMPRRQGPGGGWDYYMDFADP